MSSNLELVILDEARQLAKEKYNNNIGFSLSIIYSKLRSAGDNVAASTAYRLLEQEMENRKVYELLLLE